MRAKLPVLTRHWAVTLTVPTKGYEENVNLGVEAESMETALTAVRKTYPDARLYACHHRGDVHLRGPIIGWDNREKQTLKEP